MIERRINIRDRRSLFMKRISILNISSLGFIGVEGEQQIYYDYILHRWKKCFRKSKERRKE